MFDVFSLLIPHDWFLLSRDIVIALMGFVVASWQGRKTARRNVRTAITDERRLFLDSVENRIKAAELVTNDTLNKHKECELKLLGVNLQLRMLGAFIKKTHGVNPLVDLFDEAPQ